MSRKSQAFAEGTQKFSWKMESFADESGRVRVKCVCRNHPSIIGIGDDEQTAMRAAQKAITIAAEDVKLVSKGLDISGGQKDGL